MGIKKIDPDIIGKYIHIGGRQDHYGKLFERASDKMSREIAEYEALNKEAPITKYIIGKEK